MPKYLLRATYQAKGAQGLLREGGSSRRSTIDQLIKGMGGSMEAFYFAFGEEDVYVIADMPDDASVTAVSLCINAARTVKVSTTVLITPEVMDAAAKKSISYRAPGKIV